MPNCTVVKDNGEVCNNAFQLNTIFFFDPENQKLEKTTICQFHSDEILRLMLEEINHFKHEQMKLYSKIKNAKYNQKHYDIAVNLETMYSELQSNKDTINRLRWQFCRWVLCEDRKFFYDELIYSALVFSTKGRMRHIFYFHHKCWKQFKAKCGLQQVIQTGQKTMDMMM